MIVKNAFKFNYDEYSFLYIIRKGKKSFINDSLIIIKKNDVQLFIINWLLTTDKVRRENIFNDQRKLELRKKNRTIKNYHFHRDLELALKRRNEK